VFSQALFFLACEGLHPEKTIFLLAEISYIDKAVKEERRLFSRQAT